LNEEPSRNGSSRIRRGRVLHRPVSTRFAAEYEAGRTIARGVSARQALGDIVQSIASGGASELKESEKGAERLGIELSYQMRSVAEIEPGLERIREAGAEGMIVLPDGLVMLHRRKIIEFAALQRIPVISGWSEFARSGGTMTYGPNLKAVFQRLAIYVDKILKGANPGELAVEQPTKFELVPTFLRR
jgi:ABC-type uncharacterized transport system substrate-binding protein